MTTGSVVCATCGTKLRSQRTRCLRCGAPIAHDRREAGSRTPAALVASGAVVAVGMIAFVVLQRTPQRSSARQTTPVASGMPASRTGAAPGTTAAGAYLPAAPHVVLSANRDAAAAMSHGEVDRAIDDLTRAVNADPRNAMALNNLGLALVRAGRAADAIPYFDRAIELADTTWAYRFNRATAYDSLKQWDKAIADYRDAERLFPDDYATVFNLARALEADGNLPEAIGAFERAIRLAPGEPDFHLAHAHALEEAGRGQEAAAAYRAYLDLEPNGRDADKIKARIAQLEATPPAVSGGTAPAALAGTVAVDRRRKEPAFERR